MKFSPSKNLIEYTTICAATFTLAASAHFLGEKIPAPTQEAQAAERARIAAIRDTPAGRFLDGMKHYKLSRGSLITWMGWDQPTPR